MGGRVEGADQAPVAGPQGQPVDEPQEQGLLAQELGPLLRGGVVQHPWAAKTNERRPTSLRRPVEAGVSAALKWVK